MTSPANGIANNKLIRVLKKRLKEVGVPEDGLIMQAYMKSDMPNYGVKLTLFMASRPPTAP